MPHTDHFCSERLLLVRTEKEEDELRLRVLSSVENSGMESAHQRYGVVPPIKNAYSEQTLETPL